MVCKGGFAGYNGLRDLPSMEVGVCYSNSDTISGLKAAGARSLIKKSFIRCGVNNKKIKKIRSEIKKNNKKIYK